MLTNWPVSIWYQFFQKSFFWEQAIEIWILIPIIPRNALKLHNKKIYTKYDKICVFEKSPHENYLRKKKSWVEWSCISLLFSKSIPWLVRVYTGSFFNLYITLPWYHHQDGKLMKLNFRNFRKYLPGFKAFWHPIFKREKQNEVAGHMKHAAMAVTCTSVKLI